MIVGEEGANKLLFSQYPHMTWDNYFSGDEIMNYLGERGYGAIMTSRRDQLPKEFDKCFLHYKKMSVDSRNKVARFLAPITAVRCVPATDNNKAYVRTHVSFQSTGSTNISTINALNCNKLYVVKKDRGDGKEKF